MGEDRRRDKGSVVGLEEEEEVVGMGFEEVLGEKGLG